MKGIQRNYEKWIHAILSIQHNYDLFYQIQNINYNLGNLHYKKKCVARKPAALGTLFLFFFLSNYWIKKLALFAHVIQHAAAWHAFRSSTNVNLKLNWTYLLYIYYDVNIRTIPIYISLNRYMPQECGVTWQALSRILILQCNFSDIFNTYTVFI